MRVISENSEEDIARRHAEAEVERALQELAANMLRVIRGAGRAYELPNQAIRFLEASEAYRKAVGHYPPSDALSAMLSVHHVPDPERYGEFEYDFASAREKMIRGALQLAASRLVEQRTQERAGESELIDGSRGYMDCLEARRKEWDREVRAVARSVPRRTKGTPKKKG